MDVEFSNLRLKQTCKEDQNWKQYHSEYNIQRTEEHRLNKRVRELGQRKANDTALSDEDKVNLTRLLEIAKVKKSLAESKRVVAGYQRLKRQNELEKNQLEEELKSTQDEQKKIELTGTLREVLGHYNTEMEEWEKKVNQAEQRLKDMETKKKIVDDTKSKQLLNEALKQGFVEVLVFVCIVLGLPGVGKTHLKFLLLDKLPPCLRSSTICAETPIRIEIRTVSGTRIQNLDGIWNEVDDTGMLDVVAKMILAVEPDFVYSRPSKGIFSFITNFFQTKSSSKENTATGARPPSMASASESRNSQSTSSARSERVISDSCQKAMKRIMDRLVESITKIKNGSSVSKVPSQRISKQFLQSKWVYFIDSGGQPQYHELLPLFVRHISAAICVIRLPDKLDEIQSVEYFERGKQIGGTQKSQLSAKGTIQSLVNAVQSYSNQEQPPKIIIVGTHLDKLEEISQGPSSLTSDSEERLDQHTAHCHLDSKSIETLEEKDKQLLEMLEPEFGDQLVFSSCDMKKLIFPVNTLNPGEPEKDNAQLIRHAVEASGGKKVRIPIWWYIMELLLQELAKELGRGILSRAECLEMAYLLGIKEDSFDAALNFFNELNIIKYSPDVLPDVVFIDSQIPLDKVSELVHHSYLLRQSNSSSYSPFPVTGEWIHFRDHGVVSSECLKMFKRHYIPNIFSDKHLTKFLEDLLVFAPIPVPAWVTKMKVEQSAIGFIKYFVMPSLLLTLTDAELEIHRTSSSIAATLLVRFPNGSRRSGVFCCFVVHLIRYCGWELLLNAKEPLYRNCIKLRLVTSPPCMVTVIDSNSYIEVHVDATARVPISEYAGVLPVIKQSILSGICAACNALKYKKTKPHLTFFCPHTESSLATIQDVKPHPATLTPDRKYWSCDQLPSLFGELTTMHLIWFGIPQAVPDQASNNVTMTIGSQEKQIHNPESSKSVSSASAIDTHEKDSPHYSHSPSCGYNEGSFTHQKGVATFSQPTARNLTVMDWKDDKGERRILQVKQSMCNKWKEVGCLLEIPLPVLDAWGTTHRDNPLECINPVISHWLENSNELEYYPVTWEGLKTLLDDVELSQVSIDVNNALSYVFQHS